MPARVQLIGSTRLCRVVSEWLLERKGARIAAVDLGEEDETLPWFAPMRGFCRHNGVPLGRADADRVLDLDPDRRPTSGEGVLVRVVPPLGARSADPNRLLLDGGSWDVAVTDGRGAWACRGLCAEPGDDAEAVLDRAVLRGIEALDDAWERLEGPPEPLPRPLVAGRWRPQESWVTWELPAERVVARIRAAAGPWGGARALLGSTQVALLDARVEHTETPAGFSPRTIVAIDEGIVVATGRGTLRVARLRPGWRPARSAGGYARESGLSPGHEFS